MQRDDMVDDTLALIAARLDPKSLLSFARTAKHLENVVDTRVVTPGFLAFFTATRAAASEENSETPTPNRAEFVARQLYENALKQMDVRPDLAQAELYSLWCLVKKFIDAEWATPFRFILAKHGFLNMIPPAADTAEDQAIDLFKRCQAGDLWAARELARILSTTQGAFSLYIDRQIIDRLGAKCSMTSDAIMNLLVARLIEAANKNLYGVDYYAAGLYYFNSIPTNPEPPTVPENRFPLRHLLRLVKACAAMQISDLPNPIKKFAQTERDCLKVVFAFERGMFPEWYRQNADHPDVVAIEEILGRPEFGDQIQPVMDLIFSDKTMSKHQFVIQKVLQHLYHIIDDKYKELKDNPELINRDTILSARAKLIRFCAQIPTLSLEGMGTWFTKRLKTILASTRVSSDDFRLLQELFASVCESEAFNFEDDALHYLIKYYSLLFAKENFYFNPKYNECRMSVIHHCDALYFQSFREAQGGFFFPSFRFREKNRIASYGKLYNELYFIDDIVDIWWMQLAAQNGDALACKTISDRVQYGYFSSTTEKQDSYFLLSESILNKFGILNTSPPDPDLAKTYIDKALELNPQVIEEYLEAGRHCGLITEHIDDYLTRAAKTLQPDQDAQPRPTQLSA